jgi:hypothetical protein
MVDTLLYCNSLIVCLHADMKVPVFETKSQMGEIVTVNTSLKHKVVNQDD